MLVFPLPKGDTQPSRAGRPHNSTHCLGHDFGHLFNVSTKDLLLLPLGTRTPLRSLCLQEQQASESHFVGTPVTSGNKKIEK